MKVYELVGPRRVALCDVPIPEPGPREVLAKTRRSALSVGTEVWRYVNHGHYGGEGGRCGYNSVGEVVSVGGEVDGFRPGDLVFAGQPHAEYFVVPADRAVKLASELDLEAATFCYLPTLGLHALRSADYQAGENVLVVGLGIVGLLAAQIAAAVGARVAALETDPTRRAVAVGARIGPVLDPRAAETRDLLAAYFGPPGPDVVVETSQAWDGLVEAVRLVHPGTRLAIVGIYRSDPPPETARELLRLTYMDRDLFHNQRLKIIGCSNDPADDYPPGVVRWTLTRNTAYVADRIAAGMFDPRPAITHRFRWDELGTAYERFVAGDRGMVGVTLNWD